ncbi:hypothetical protein [Thermocoleostomius sinensis]|jgi:hypothetical protein|uniref:Uncharacterized protein n=1 Tax=Thermocoleostomius sinensis A174 TaxID=2016057 RepID=A0A9E9C3I8_9CYAN|nr:hypothetical protein [Thermocoleostomius sinensis]WAL59011.1 hypothetical protein OXH18_17770 [Thermocoleostomius sinensis A174]
MGIEHRMFKGAFLPSEVVQLRQTCFTPGRVFEPGTYLAGELPDLAFEMGLVDRLPPVRGKNAEIRDSNEMSDTDR